MKRIIIFSLVARNCRIGSLHWTPKIYCCGIKMHLFFKRKMMVGSIFLLVIHILQGMEVSKSTDVFIIGDTVSTYVMCPGPDLVHSCNYNQNKLYKEIFLCRWLICSSASFNQEAYSMAKIHSFL